jgi:hypothetical protein
MTGTDDPIGAGILEVRAKIILAGDGPRDARPLLGAARPAEDADGERRRQDRSEGETETWAFRR